MKALLEEESEKITIEEEIENQVSTEQFSSFDPCVYKNTSELVFLQLRFNTLHLI